MAVLLALVRLQEMSESRFHAAVRTRHAGQLDDQLLDPRVRPGVNCMNKIRPEFVNKF
jgi:hypothetical protein